MPTGRITPISPLVGKIDRGAGTNDHNKLINRDMADQHPMEAIIGLLDALRQIDSKILTLDQKIDSEADFVALELNKLRAALNAFKITVNAELRRISVRVDAVEEELQAQIILLQENIQRVEGHLQEVEANLQAVSDKVDALIPTLNTSDETVVTLSLEDNAETVFENPIEQLTIEIPNGLVHGFSSFVSFITANSGASVIFDKTEADKPLKFIFNGSVIAEDELEFTAETQYNLVFLCNGICLEVYAQEIQLL